MTVRWGVLGAGWIVQTATGSAIHAAPNATLSAVASRDVSRAQKVQPQRTHESYQDLIDDEAIDAVYIALTNDQHEPWITKAIDAGKHVLCEKPLTLSAQTSAAAFAEAERAGVLLIEAAWSMWHPRTQRIVELVSSGALGDVEAFLGSFTFDSVPDGNYRLDPSFGGGALLDVGVYPLHALVACGLASCVADAEVEHTMGGLGVDMTTRASLPLVSGGTARIVASFAMPESQRLLVRGSRTHLSVPDDDAFTSWQEPSRLRVGDGWESFPAVDAYCVMFEAVSRRVNEESAWVLPTTQSVRVAELVDSLTPQIGRAHV